MILKNLQGNFYFQTDKAALSNWFVDKSFYGFKSKQGEFSFRLWGEWKNQQVDNIQANINLTNLTLQPLNNTKSLMINKLSANLFWKHLSSGGWELNSDKIMLMLDNTQWDMTKFGIWVLHPVVGEKKTASRSQFLKTARFKVTLKPFLRYYRKKFRQSLATFFSFRRIKKYSNYS